MAKTTKKTAAKSAKRTAKKVNKGNPRTGVGADGKPRMFGLVVPDICLTPAIAKAVGVKAKVPSMQAQAKAEADAKARVAIERRRNKLRAKLDAERQPATISPVQLSDTKGRPLPKGRSSKVRHIPVDKVDTAVTAKLAKLNGHVFSGKLDVRNAKCLSAKIQLLIDRNPRHEGTRAYKMFALYRNGMTVREFFKAGGGIGDVKWDVNRKHIALVG